MLGMDLPTDPYLTFPSPEPYLLEGRMRIIVQLTEDVEASMATNYVERLTRCVSPSSK